MLKLDHLVHTCKDHFMLSHDCPAADRGDPDLLAVSLPAHLASVVYIMIFSVQRFVDGIRQRQRRAAWSVQLLVVVAFHQLHVISCRGEHLCRVLQKLQQQIDPHGHIRGLQDCRFFGCFGNLLQLLLRISRGTEHRRDFSFHTVRQNVLQGGGDREVDHHIHADITFCNGVKDRIRILHLLIGIYSRCDRDSRILLHQAGDHLSHPSVASMHQNIYHVVLLLVYDMSLPPEKGLRHK